jgi:acid stress-induced BolA-like protein IbaG/YrbA
MITEDVRSRVLAVLPGAIVRVEGDGSRLTIGVISAQFEGMARVKKQQLVYAAIGDLIATGALHAVTIKAQTPGEAGSA